MATTFSSAFKNTILDWLTGRTTSGNALLRYVNFYNGAQAADPSTTPAGSLEFSTITYGPSLSGMWSAADNNATAFLTTPVGPTTPSGAASVSSLTFARFYNSSQAPMIDTPLAVAAGAGVGVVVDSLTSTAGVGTTITMTQFKLPLDNGSTLSISTSLARRLVDLCTGAVTVSANNIPQFGINTQGACTLTVYDGAVPANADEPITSQNALVTFSIGATQLWASATGGSSSMSITLGSSAAVASGTATFCRMVKNNGSNVYTIQGSVGASGADFVIGTTSITTGNTYTLTDAVISL